MDEIQPQNKIFQKDVIWGKMFCFILYFYSISLYKTLYTSNTLWKLNRGEKKKILKKKYKLYNNYLSWG